MSQRKNINQLFQEKLENHQIIPEEIVWKNIETKLQEKKKRRIIPFWWKLSGIAAVFVLGLFLYTDLESIDWPENSIVNQEKENINNSTKTIKINQPMVSKEVEKTNRNKNENKNYQPINQDHKPNKTNVSKSTLVTNSEPFNTNNKNVVSNQNKTNKNNKSPKISNNFNKINQLAENQFSQNKEKQASSLLKNKSENKITAISKNESQDHQIKDKVANTTSIEPQKGKEKNILTFENFNDSIENKKTSVANSELFKLELNTNTEDSINKKIEPIVIAPIEPNALEELLNEKESQINAEQKINRWQISSTVAPIYFSSTSNGSPLDVELKNNDKTYSASNISYGVGVNYTLNKKIKIRSGINILNIDYNTNGILYYHSIPVSSRLSALNPNAPGKYIIIESMNNVTSFFNKPIQKYEGSLNQKFGYIEMPIEVTYSIFNKKLGVDLIGGMSTLILNRNEIFLQSSELNMKIGEANNLNNIHFSGNIGLGLKYNIWKKIQARVEPVFKYQVNTFNKEAGNFKPYIIGVYSGLSYTF